MKHILILASIVLTMAGSLLANGLTDIEAVITVGSNAQDAVTVQGVNGWVNSVGIDTASGSTGNVTVAIQASPSTLASRTIVSTNNVSADLWLDPSDAASRRYAITDKDTISLTVSNLTVTAKTYRAVIRVESAK